MASKRSDKSLGTLALRVLALQEASGASTFSIDGTAASLQTERRRLYDLVAVLEALEFVTRVRKGDYSWHGRARLAVAIARMSSSEDAPEDGQQRGGLRYIAVQLVRLFLAKSQLSLDETVSSILGEPVRPASAAAAALARRVYDIFNVLSASRKGAASRAADALSPRSLRGCSGEAQHERQKAGVPVARPRRCLRRSRRNRRGQTASA